MHNRIRILSRNCFMAVGGRLALFFGIAAAAYLNAGRMVNPSPGLSQTHPGALSDSPVNRIAESIKVIRLDDKEENIQLSKQRKSTVLYVFSPTCNASISTAQNVEKLASSRGNAYRFIGLSLAKGNGQSLIDLMKVNFPVFVNAEGNAQKLSLGAVPQTLVISPEGRIVKSWVGEFGQDLKREVETYFNIQLPEKNTRNSCTYCVDDHAVASFSSPGALVDSNGRRLRCKMDGKWGIVK